MKKARRTKKKGNYFRRYLLIAVFLFVSAAAASYLYFKPKLAFEVPFIENIESQHAETRSGDEEEKSLRLYKSRTDVPNDNDDLRRGALLVTAEDIIKKSLEPLNVKLLDLYMDKNGTIYADFSSELIKNFNGDASEEYRLIADLYEKIKINIPDFRSLKILIDGKEADSFGGHIDISKPIGEKIEGVIQRKTYRYF